MPYNEALAERVRALLAGERDLGERRMFGGITFVLGGNFCVGVHNDDLIVRTDPAEHEATLARPHVREMDITGRPSRGWIFVAGEGLRTKRQLEAWVGRGVTFARSLPAKKAQSTQPKEAKRPAAKRSRA